MLSFEGYRVCTIGYGGRTIEALLQQMHEHNIHLLADVRSAPYSRYQPSFSRDALARSVRAAGMRYSFLGKELGGRPQDPTCYDSKGHVVYERVRAKSFFREGMARLLDACKNGLTPCLLCAEVDPSRCHRTAMVGEALQEAGAEVVHLLKDGTTKSQSAVMLDRGSGQYSLF